METLEDLINRRISEVGNDRATELKEVQMIISQAEALVKRYGKEQLFYTRGEPTAKYLRSESILKIKGEKHSTTRITLNAGKLSVDYKSNLLSRYKAVFYSNFVDAPTFSNGRWVDEVNLLYHRCGQRACSGD